MPWREEITKGNFRRGFAPAFIVVVNSLTWITFTSSFFSDLVNGLPIPYAEMLGLFVAEYAAIAFSAIFSSLFLPRSRRLFLFMWMLSGVLASCAMTTVPNNSTPVNLLISLFVGTSLGCGLPSTLSCFADATSVENRGFFGGITFFFVGLSTVFLVAVMSLFGSAMLLTATVLWRLAGAFLFVFTYRRENFGEEENAPSYSSLLSRHDLILYVVPWAMFCLINFIEAPLVSNLFGDLFSLMGFIEVVLMGFFALIGGFLADFVGRKRVIIVGFVILGVNYAMLSLLSSTSAWYVYTTLDSIAWGMFAAVFFMALWGDLAAQQRKEKYYTIGGLSYLLAVFFSELVKPYVGILSLTTAFSLASFFLFLAVLPLMYAPETLPEKKMKDRELRDYVEKARKAKQKYT